MSNYKDSNVLVTGGAGFIGSELVRQLCGLNAKVTILDDFSSGDANNLKGLDVTIVNGDVRNEKLMKKVVEDQEKIFHLAARPFIPTCYKRPKEFFEVNAMGTMNVMLAAMKKNPELIVHVSSSEVYGSAQYVVMDENHPTLPHSTYAVSKLAADRMCFTLYKEHGLPITTIRPFNTYGPRETHPYIIPVAIYQLSKGNTLRLGNLETSRDFTYVGDTVRGLVLAGENKHAIGAVINLGTGKEIKMCDLVYLIARLMGKSDVDIFLDKSKLRTLDVDRLVADGSKAQKILGWEPKVSLEEGLRRTIDWFVNNGNHWPWEDKYTNW